MSDLEVRKGQILRIFSNVNFHPQGVGISASTGAIRFSLQFKMAVKLIKSNLKKQNFEVISETIRDRAKRTQFWDHMVC